MTIRAAAEEVQDEAAFGVLSSEEGRAFFDQQARCHLGISGDEFIRRYESGEFDAVLDDSPEMMHLVMLLPLAQ